MTRKDPGATVCMLEYMYESMDKDHLLLPAVSDEDGIYSGLQVRPNPKISEIFGFSPTGPGPPHGTR